MLNKKGIQIKSRCQGEGERVNKKGGIVGCYIYGHYISALFNLTSMSIFCYIR